MYTYQTFFKNKRIIVEASTPYAALQEAAKQLKVPEKKQHTVHVVLMARPDGTEVIHTADS